MSQNPRARRLTPCHRHPDLKTTTGLCAPCLHERLTLLNPSTTSSSSAAAPPTPELRRCKTFSAKNRDAALFEPRRRSCDVQGRNSLSSLLDIDGNGDGKVESRNLGLMCPVPVVREEEEEEEEEEEVDDDESVPEAKIEVARVPKFQDESDFDFEDGKTMKEFIDLELEATGKGNNRKDFKDIAGSFFGAASVFSKKLRKWRRKQEGSRRDGGNGAGNCNGGDGNRVLGVSLGEMRIENLRGRRLSYTQSEVGDYGFGRRSTDTYPRGSLDLGRASIDCVAFGRKSCDSEDPRFSIDLGRASVDGGRVSVDDSKSVFVEVPKGEFDAPRASWDGYLIGNGGGGGRTLPLPRRGAPPVVSVIENAMATVYGFDNRVLGEGKVKMQYGDEKDSLKTQRRGFDRCSSVKKEMVGMPEDAEVKGLSNARVSPAAIGIFNGTKLLITEKELNEWRLNSSSVKDDSSESFETASKDLASVSSSSNGKDYKKCPQWSKLWNLWGLLHRKKGDKSSEEDELTRAGVASPDSTARNGNRGALVRSHSTTSSRCSSSVVGSGSGTTSRVDSKAIIRRRQDDVLEKSRSVSSRYSPNQLDNGLLRFYLTPLRSRRRNKLGKSRLKKSHSLARSVLKLY